MACSGARFRRDNALWQEAVDKHDALAAEAGMLVDLENLPEFEAFLGPRLRHVGVTLDDGHASADMGIAGPGRWGVDQVPRGCLGAPVRA